MNYANITFSEKKTYILFTYRYLHYNINVIMYVINGKSDGILWLHNH